MEIFTKCVSVVVFFTSAFKLLYVQSSATLQPLRSCFVSFSFFSCPAIAFVALTLSLALQKWQSAMSVHELGEKRSTSMQCERERAVYACSVDFSFQLHLYVCQLHANIIVSRTPNVEFCLHRCASQTHSQKPASVSAAAAAAAAAGGRY